MTTFDYVTEHGWLFVLIILAVFGLIVIGVILLKKYAPHFKSQEKPKSEEEIAKEEVDRLTRPVEDDVPAKKEEVKEEKVAEKAPTNKEAADYESHRATVSSEDQSFAKQMEEYAKAHPEEEELSSSNAIKNDDKTKK
jgi:hypothetical protein